MLISKYAQHLTVDVLACVRHFHFRNGIQFFQRGRIRNVFSKHQLHQLGKAAGCRCRGDRTAADQHCRRDQHRRNPSHFPVRSVTSCRHAGCGTFWFSRWILSCAFRRQFPARTGGRNRTAAAVPDPVPAAVPAFPVQCPPVPALLCLCRNIGIIGDHYVINGHGFGAVFPQPVVPLGTGNAGEIAGEVFRPHLGAWCHRARNHVCGEFLQILCVVWSAGELPAGLFPHRRYSVSSPVPARGGSVVSAVPAAVASFPVSSGAALPTEAVLPDSFPMLLHAASCRLLSGEHMLRETLLQCFLRYALCGFI